jgi:phosphatidylserine decarboxylase
MRIDPAGWPFIAGPLAPAAALTAAGRVTGRRWPRRAAWPLVALSAYMTVFFRDPDRRCDVVPPDPDDVVDVHVNRSPYHGEVVECSYRKGSFLAAYRKESAYKNERSEIWLRDGEGDADGDGDRTLVFRQIVGVLARRIVTRIGPGQKVATGERIGLMKFGSRMDVFVPRECTITVSKGQRVRGGETVIARWPAR